MKLDLHESRSGTVSTRAFSLWRRVGIATAGFFAGLGFLFTLSAGSSLAIAVLLIAAVLAGVAGFTWTLVTSRMPSEGELALPQSGTVSPIVIVVYFFGLGVTLASSTMLAYLVLADTSSQW